MNGDGGRRPAKVMSVLGTRPEVIKLAPVLRALRDRPERFRTIAVNTSQHLDLVEPIRRLLGVAFDIDLDVMRPGQGLNQLCARIMAALDPVLVAEAPQVVLVQGDTTSALAGALAARYRRIPVAHVEAGLRTDDPDRPFPEEMNRRLITRLASLHFAATRHNVRTLLAEGVPEESIVLTGNPVVDALIDITERSCPSQRVTELLSELGDRRLIVLTTHRRENFGAAMRGHLEVLRRFVERHEDIVLVFPVHPNPAVRKAAFEVLHAAPRVWLVQPLDHAEFVYLLMRAWLIVSDSGGVQEEAPSLGKPLLVLREHTERPEAVECGIARLVGESPARLAKALDEIEGAYSWLRHAGRAENPFGRGDAGPRIAAALASFLGYASAETAKASLEVVP
jgi:UDP-N-acetylglucosamine 2-epimerase (non-hydrolysing)